MCDALMGWGASAVTQRSYRLLRRADDDLISLEFQHGLPTEGTRHDSERGKHRCADLYRDQHHIRRRYAPGDELPLVGASRHLRGLVVGSKGTLGQLDYFCSGASAESLTGACSEIHFPWYRFHDRSPL
jgi:hypothetical protein